MLAWYLISLGQYSPMGSGAPGSAGTPLLWWCLACRVQGQIMHVCEGCQADISYSCVYASISQSHLPIYLKHKTGQAAWNEQHLLHNTHTYTYSAKHNLSKQEWSTLPHHWILLPAKSSPKHIIHLLTCVWSFAPARSSPRIKKSN